MSGFQAAIYDWVKATGTIRLDPHDEAIRVAASNKRQARAYAPLQNKCMELRKVCNHPFLNYPPRGFLVNDCAVRSCGKLWILDRILVKLHRTGHRVLLFSTMTKLLDILEEYLQWRRLTSRRIDGTTSLDAREASIVDFNKPGSDIFIFLLSIRAAGRGLNLQSADTVVIYDPDPNPKNEEQAVARAHRIGQKREVRVLYMEAVVEKIFSYQKEDELRSGGRVDIDDDLAGKDRYMGSVESLVRNNIQQHKIDMADEVINAGRFDQRTSQEERRLTLEALLHDEERYQQTVHDVPTLQEVNRMIARTDEEVELFDQMDEEGIWPSDLLVHQEIPKWLRVGLQEVEAAVAATSKQAMKQGFVGAVGTVEAEKKLLAKAAKSLRKLSKRKAELEIEPEVPSQQLPIGNFKSKRRRYQEEERIPEVEEVEEEEEEEEEGGLALGHIDEELVSGEEEGEIAADVVEDGQDIAAEMELEEGEMEEERQTEHNVHINHVEVVEEADDDLEDQGYPSPLSSSDDDEEHSQGVMHVDASRRQFHGSQTRRFGSLSAIESRPAKHEEIEDLEEGEIAVSGSPDKRVESWGQDRNGTEEEQVVQPQMKRKRSNLQRVPRMTNFVSTERISDGFGVRDAGPSYPLLVPRFDPRQVQVQRVADDAVDFQYERCDQWPPNARQLIPPSFSGRPYESLSSSRPRIVFKHNWSNGFQEPLEETSDLGRESWVMKVSSMSAPASNGGFRMVDSTQRKCKEVLAKLQGAVNKEGRAVAALFMELPKRNENPDYYKVINRPVDARIIEQHLDHYEYASVIDFAGDVQLMLDNAVRYNGTSEVQADARRFQALFFQRMGLMFRDVDFSSVRAKSLPLVIRPAPHGSHKPLVCIEGVKPAREVSTATRWSSALSIVKGSNTADAELQIKETSAKGKKKRKSGREIKELKKNSELISGRDKVDDSRSGVMHPVDLVILKKKRKGRERVAGKSVSEKFNGSYSLEEVREHSGNNVGNRRSVQLSKERVQSNLAGTGKVVIQEKKVVDKIPLKPPKLKRSWMGSNKRGPN